jgi:hypothetical protein
MSISIRNNVSIDKIEKLLFQQEEEILRKDGCGLHQRIKIRSPHDLKIYD